MVKRAFNFVYQEVRGLHQAAYILALFAFGSQILAIVRDRLLAHTFGAGAELDLYYAAFRIPDLMFVLFASVLSIYVLLPFVNKHTEFDTAAAGARVLSQVFTVFLYTYIVIAILLALTAPFYVPYVFLGFSGDSTMLILLLQILLIQPFLLGLSSLCGVVTQMNRRFILYALSPLLYNIGIILGIAFFYPVFGLVGLVVGVIVGSLGHLLVQVPFVIKSQYAFSIIKKIDWLLIRDILIVSVPRALTLSVNQLVLLIFVGMASAMTAGSVSVFQFAFNLQSVPLAIIGVSYSVAAFPTLSNLHYKGDRSNFNTQLIVAFRHIIFWSIPIITLVIVLRAQIVRVLLGSGAFDWSDTRLTAAMLAIFVISLLAQSILLLLIRAFYAEGKTFLPLCVAIFSAVFSVVLALILKTLYLNLPEIQIYINSILRLQDVFGSEVLVLAIAFTLGQFVQLIILLLFSKRNFRLSYGPLFKLLLQAILAGAVGAIFAYVTLFFVEIGINQGTFIGILLQGITSGVMGVVGVVLTYAACGSKELLEIYKSFQSRIFSTDVIAPQ